MNDESHRLSQKSPVGKLADTVTEHLEAAQKLLDSHLEDIQRSGDVICLALQKGHKILFCGNGGSAADAQHIAAELVGRYEDQRRAWPAIALTTDTSALTAVSNDYGYEQVFARQVEALASRGDVLVAISTSGRSRNVIRAVEMAQSIGCHTIALTGKDGEPLVSLCELAVAVPSLRTARVQEIHILIGHLWCEMVDQQTEV